MTDSGLKYDISDSCFAHSKQHKLCAAYTGDYYKLLPLRTANPITNEVLERVGYRAMCFKFIAWLLGSIKYRLLIIN